MPLFNYNIYDVISHNMRIIHDFDNQTIVECFKASCITINISDIKIIFEVASSNLDRKPRFIFSITDDIAVIDADFIDIEHFTKQKTITCGELLRTFREYKLKQLLN